MQTIARRIPRSIDLPVVNQTIAIKTPIVQNNTNIMYAIQHKM